MATTPEPASQSFLEHTFSADDRLWLGHAATTPSLDPRLAKVALHGRLSPSFDPQRIDRRFYDRSRLTLLGVRVFDPHNEVFALLDKIIRSVRDRILRAPGIDSFSAEDLVLAAV